MILKYFIYFSWYFSPLWLVLWPHTADMVMVVTAATVMDVDMEDTGMEDMDMDTGMVMVTADMVTMYTNVQLMPSQKHP